MSQSYDVIVIGSGIAGLSFALKVADPSARRDLERFIDRLVPENDPDFTHTYEGPDDMPKD